MERNNGAGAARDQGGVELEGTLRFFNRAKVHWALVQNRTSHSCGALMTATFPSRYLPFPKFG